MTYGSDGKLQTWHYGNPTATIPVYVTSTVSLDGNGNLASDQTVIQIVNSSSTSNSKRAYKYSGFDSKNNPYTLLAKAMGLSYYFTGADGSYLSDGMNKNNPGTIVETDSDDINNTYPDVT